MTKNFYNWLIPSLSVLMFAETPILNIWHPLFFSSGLINSFFVIFILCYIFYFISSIIVKPIISDKIGIFEIIENYFGKQATLFCIALIVLIFCLWFTQHFDYLQSTVCQNFFEKEVPAYILFQSFLIFLLLSASLSACNNVFIAFSVIVAPFIFFSIIVVSYILIRDIRLENIKFYASSLDVTLIIPLLNNLLTAIFAIPIFYKSSIRYKSNKINLKVIYLIFFPFFACLGIVFGLFGKNCNDIISSCLSYGDIEHTIIIAYIFVIECFTNVLNFYFAFGFISYITSTKNRIIPVLIISTVCILAFKVPYLEKILVFLNAILASIITVIIINHVTKQKYKENSDFLKNNIISLSISIFILLFCEFGYVKITGMLLFDAVIISSILSLRSFDIYIKAR
jgi:hypothetical protein